APASGTLSSIRVGEDETVEVGVELAVIDEGGSGAAPAPDAPAQGQPAPEQAPDSAAPEAPPQAQPEPQQAPEPQQQPEPEPEPQQPAAQQAPPQQAPPQPAPVAQQAAPVAQQAAPPAPPQQAAPPSLQQPAAAQTAPAPQPADQGPDGEATGGAYVTPLVRKLAAEHDVDLAGIRGTGVGGRIRKQDVLEAARSRQETQPQAEPEPATSNGRAAAAAPAGAPVAAPPRVEPSPLRGRTEKMSRLRGVIAKRMTESLQTSAQLTTVVEADVTRIARLRQQAKADFERREGVKLSFLPFFAVATVEALKQHPNVNASI